MTEYYIASNSTDEKIIGKKYPQCKGLPSGMGLTFDWFDRPNSMTNLNNDEFPNFEPELFFELEEKAILTDIISPSNVSAKGFLVNQKVKDILSEFNLMEHKYYPATLIVKGDKLKYYWLHFYDNEEKYLNGIDYKLSNFFISDLTFRKTDDIIIVSRDDFWKKKMSLPMKHIRVNKLKFTQGIQNENLDLFYVTYIHSDYWISDRLAKRLLALNIKGINTKEQDIL